MKKPESQGKKEVCLNSSLLDPYLLSPGAVAGLLGEGVWPAAIGRTEVGLSPQGPLLWGHICCHCLILKRDCEKALDEKKMQFHTDCSALVSVLWILARGCRVGV